MHLKHARRRQKRGNQKDNRGIIPNRVPIEKRPKLVEKRIRSGAIEVDFMTNRATLHTSLHKLNNRRSEIVSKAIIKKLEQADYPMHTVTFIMI